MANHWWPITGGHQNIDQTKKENPTVTRVFYNVWLPSRRDPEATLTTLWQRPAPCSLSDWLNLTLAQPALVLIPNQSNQQMQLALTNQRVIPSPELDSKCIHSEMHLLFVLLSLQMGRSQFILYVAVSASRLNHHLVKLMDSSGLVR